MTEIHPLNKVRVTAERNSKLF